MGFPLTTCPQCDTPLTENLTGHLECPVCGLYLNSALLSLYKKEEEHDEHETNPGV